MGLRGCGERNPSAGWGRAVGKCRDHLEDPTQGWLDLEERDMRTDRADSGGGVRRMPGQIWELVLSRRLFLFTGKNAHSEKNGN